VPSDRPTFRPKGLNATWKTIALIGTIAGVGFVGSQYLDRYQTAERAIEQHTAIETRSKASVDALGKDIEKHTEELEAVRYVNVRIEIGQQQILDELRRTRLENRQVRNSAERIQRIEDLEELDERLELREKALEGSYKLRPIVPRAGSGDAPMQRDDPLSAAAAL
jgi:hypothetical protein